MGLGVRRTVLHRALVDRASSLGVECRWRTRVDRLTQTGIDTSRGPIDAGWTIGADGLHSRVRQWADLEAPSRGVRRFGSRQHYEVEPWADLVEVYWADGCEAYVTPVSDHEVGVAVLWSASGSLGLVRRFGCSGLLPAARGTSGRGPGGQQEAGKRAARPAESRGLSGACRAGR